MEQFFNPGDAVDSDPIQPFYRFIGVKELCLKLNIRKVKLYELIAEGRIPAPCHITAGRRGWPDNVITDLMIKIARGELTL